MNKDNPMRYPKIEKIVVNLCVGETGRRRDNAEKIIETITDAKPVRTYANSTVQAFKVKKGDAIGIKVSLRRKKAIDFLNKALEIQGKTLYLSQFDELGNFSFGIEEHTEFGLRYDPNIGIFGMNVNVVLKRSGNRITKRRRQKAKMPQRHNMTKEDAAKFIKEEFSVEVIE